MTTDDPAQLSLRTYEEEVLMLQHALDIRLSSIQSWVKLPEERTDWALEELLREIGVYAAALREIRNSMEIPF